MSSPQAGGAVQPAAFQPATSRRAVLICNARSRRGEEWYPQIRQQLLDAGFELSVAELVRDPKRMGPMVEQAVRDEVPLIIVGGGDGTMSSSADILRSSSSVMGVLPLGTGNAFARDLGIPVDVEGACKVLVEGRPLDVDLGLAGKKVFVNVATVGLTTRIAEALTDDAKRKLGRFVYAFAIAKAVYGIKPFVATLKRDGRTETFETMQVVFGSGRFHAGPFPVTPDAEITDHVLHGYALKTRSKGTLLKYAFSMWGGHHVNLPEVEVFTMKAGTLSTEPRKLMVIDGEVSQRTPIDLRIDPAALKVLVSPEFHQANRPLIKNRWRT